MVAIDAQQKAKLMHDLNLVIEDAQVLLRMTADQVGDRGRAPLVWHVHHFDPGHALKQFHRHMLRGAVAARPIIELARLCLD